LVQELGSLREHNSSIVAGNINAVCGTISWTDGKAQQYVYRLKPVDG
jgi:hypothetical protein